MSSQIIKLSANPNLFGREKDELDPAMFSSTLPIQHSHMIVEDDNMGLYVGVWDTNDMIEAPGPYPCDEFMVVLEGQAQIKNMVSGEVEQVNAGQSFVIAKGYDCQWQQRGYLRKYFMIWQHPQHELPTTPSATSLRIDGQAYLDTTGHFSSGSSDQTTYSAQLKPHPSHEFIYVTGGTLIVYNEQQELTLIAGEAAFITQQTMCRFKASFDFSADYARLSLTN